MGSSRQVAKQPVHTNDKSRNLLHANTSKTPSKLFPKMTLEEIIAEQLSEEELLIAETEAPEPSSKKRRRRRKSKKSKKSKKKSKKSKKKSAKKARKARKARKSSKKSKKVSRKSRKVAKKAKKAQKIPTPKTSTKQKDCRYEEESRPTKPKVDSF